MQRIEKMMNRLNFDRSLLFTTDVSYYKFLNRLHDMELTMRAEGLWEVPHPWVNLLIPRSSMTKFDAHVLKSLVADAFSGPVLVYPLNRSKYELLCQFWKTLKISHHEAVDNSVFISKEIDLHLN